MEWVEAAVKSKNKNTKIEFPKAKVNNKQMQRKKITQIV